jgi:D-glutamate N-acetyltransferase
VKRYAIFGEGCSADPDAAKTLHGIVRYAPAPTVVIVDSARAPADHDGVPVVATLAEVMERDPTTLAIGIAPDGGRLEPSWRAFVMDAMRHGLDVEAGLHTFLGDDPELVRLARETGVTIRDLRRPPEGLGVPTGANGAHGARVVHTVGSDCAIGKKSVALELDRAARRRGMSSVFVPTGQTGVAIAGWGIAVDAVPADFLAGAGEQLVVEGARRGDLLWVEGQGSLLHPAYAGVTLGLMHGVLPHALVLCHRHGATHIHGLPDHPIPPLREVVALYETVGLAVRRAPVAAIAVNTLGLSDDEARAAIDAASSETGLPAGDPVRFGADELLAPVLDESNILDT